MIVVSLNIPDKYCWLSSCRSECDSYPIWVRQLSYLVAAAILNSCGNHYYWVLQSLETSRSQPTLYREAIRSVVPASRHYYPKWLTQ